MKSNSITIRKINYDRKNECRIFQTCLKNWFSDPKALHLTEPKLRYPFDFEKWMKFFYSREKETWVLLKNDWITACISFRYCSGEKNGQLLHIFVDKDYRRNGYGKKLIFHTQDRLKELRCSHVTMKIHSGNKSAIHFFHSVGFQMKSIKTNKTILMEKFLKKSNK